MTPEQRIENAEKRLAHDIEAANIRCGRAYHKASTDHAKVLADKHIAALFPNNVTPEDVHETCDLLARLTKVLGELAETAGMATTGEVDLKELNRELSRIRRRAALRTA